ncbi:hypothetical protein KP79_PYT01707 [Mizuhopecten yessoensis]|uniref:YitH/HolE acetyltransferase (GNAT) domain-containing protein n=1 Tax=Mizuhopecten yessoensis TaxID=6573 RepID=A0A210Q6K4_MIZYE|nr:hypothetical protein KP79_PYT01707 [Mizuhopecten yessoensis]
MNTRYGFSPSNSYMTWYNYGRIDPRTCLINKHEDLMLLPVEHVLLSDLIKYDTGVHHVPRPEYLYHWITSENSITYVAFRDGTICGYGVLRSQDCYNQIGPLYADDNRVALALFRHLNSHLSEDQTVGFSCPVTNGFATHFATKNRMMKPGFPLVFMSKPTAFEPDLRRVYAMSSVSFGLC